MFWKMIRIEQEKMLRMRMFWIELALLTFLIPAGFSYGLIIKDTFPPDNLNALSGPYGTLVPLALIYSYDIIGIMIVILVGSFVAQEYNWRTVQLWVSRGVRRSALLGAQLVVICVTILALMLAIFLLSRTFSVLFSPLFMSAASAKALVINWSDIIYGYMCLFLGLLPYGALTFLLAIVTRSSLIAVSVGLTFVIIVENVLVQMLGALGTLGTQIAEILPTRLASRLIESSSASLSSQSPAVIGILLYTVVFLGIAFWHFQRQDLTN